MKNIFKFILSMIVFVGVSIVSLVISMGLIYLVINRWL